MPSVVPPPAVLAPASPTPAARPLASLAALPAPVPGRSRVAAALPVLLSAVLGGVIGGGAALAAKRLAPALPHLPPGAKWSVLAVLPFILFTVVLAHELGHLAAGRLAGTRAQLLVVGPLMVVRGPDGWRVRRNRALGLAGGLALTAPVGAMAADVERVRAAMLRIVIGGPAASLLFAAAAASLALAAAAPGAAAARAAWVATCAVAALLSAGIGLVCLLPMRGGAFDTDGRQALDLRRAAPAAARKAAHAALASLDLAGTRPRDWPPALVAALLDDLSSGTDVLGTDALGTDALGTSASGTDAVGSVAARAAPLRPARAVFVRLMAASHAADTGRPAEARAHVAAALAGRSAVAKPLRGGLLLEGAWVAARHDGDVDGARSLLAEAEACGRGLDLARHQRPLVDAALAWRVGDRAAAGTALMAARTALASAPALTGGSVMLVQDRLAALADDVARLPRSVA